MKWTHAWMTVCAAGALFLAASCSKDYTDKENSHILFSKGTSLKASGQYVKACDAFESFLAICPKSARTHKELAELYGDYRSDFVKAIFHYEKYLELKSNLSDMDRKEIRKLIDKNKKNFYEQYQMTNGLAPIDSSASGMIDGGPAQELETSLAAARQTERAIAEKYKELYLEKKKLEEDLKTLKSKALAASSARGTETIPSIRVPSQPDSSSAHTSSAVKGSSYTVQKGDTLTGIALKVYGRKSAWKQIRDANPGMIPENGAVRIGQTIILPRQ